MREQLTVLVPCWNEEDTVEATVADILAVAPSLPVDVRVLLIDDGSTDRTRDRMRALCERDSRCELIAHDRNRGMGRCVVEAYERIAPESWVTVVPGDNEFVFESIHNFLAVRDRYDILLGYLQNPVIRTFPRRLASAAFTSVARVLYAFPYRYLNGMKMYRARCFQGIEVISGGHGFNAELLAKAILRDPRLRIGEVPFISRGRALGQSKAFRMGAIWRAVRELYVGQRSVARFRREVVRAGPRAAGAARAPADLGGS